MSLHYRRKTAAASNGTFIGIALFTDPYGTEHTSEEIIIVSATAMEEQTLTLTSEAEREREPEKDEAMSDSDDSDSEDEAQQNIQMESLQTELAANPSNYDAHLQYINILRKTGDIDRLTKAREAMSEIFPLSPPTWQQWIKDELSLNTASRPEAFSRVLKLYERGVFDYL
ncbi:squamous cell carcinoma antigen recognized by T-cells 3-like protein, partial [Trifolium pratense]